MFVFLLSLNVTHFHFGIDQMYTNSVKIYYTFKKEIPKIYVVHLYLKKDQHLEGKFSKIKNSK